MAKKLKDWFDKELAIMLATKVQKVFPEFDSANFEKTITDTIPPLELKDRVEVFADEMYRSFHQDYLKGLGVLMAILGPENPKETGMFTEFYWIMPIAKYVEKYGIDHFEASMNAIEEITKRNTGEYTIRPFLERETERTLQVMLAWSRDKNSHVRRLASEGVRPRLPWAPKLEVFVESPALLVPILTNLRDDPSKYVQKSVANCLNDILKDNQAKAKDVIEQWNGNAVGKERKWIIKHALRNLLKKEDPWALSMVK